MSLFLFKPGECADKQIVTNLRLNQKLYYFHKQKNEWLAFSFVTCDIFAIRTNLIFCN